MAEAARTSFPSRIAPELVLEFLDLPSLASALRASVNFSTSSEAVFQEVARRHGIMVRLNQVTWRDVVRLECLALTWIGVMVYDDLHPAELGRVLPEFRDVDGLGSSRVTHFCEENDIWIVARGAPLDQVTEWTWRVKMTKIPGIVDRCGLAFHSPEAKEIEHACFWNSDGHSYDPEPSWLVDVNGLLSDDHPNPVFEETCTLEISFRNEGPGAWTVEFRVIDVNGTRRTENWDQITRTKSTPWRNSDIHVAPFVEIFVESAASLEHAPPPQ